MTRARPGVTALTDSDLRDLIGCDHTPEYRKALYRELLRARRALRAALPHHQGGHSKVGALIRKALGTHGARRRKGGR